MHSSLNQPKEHINLELAKKGTGFSSFVTFHNPSTFELNIATMEEESAIETPTSPELKQEPFFHSLEESLEFNKTD